MKKEFTIYRGISLLKKDLFGEQRQKHRIHLELIFNWISVQDWGWKWIKIKEVSHLVMCDAFYPVKIRIWRVKFSEKIENEVLEVIKLFGIKELKKVIPHKIVMKRIKARMAVMCLRNQRVIHLMLDGKYINQHIHFQWQTVIFQQMGQ
jgi:hypothetical protein